MVEIAVYILYTLAFLKLISVLPFFRCEGLSKKMISGLFLLKLLVGFIFFLIYYYYYGHNRETGDGFRFYDDALVLAKLAFNDPIAFIQLLTGLYTEGSLHHYTDQANYWFRGHQFGMFNENRTFIRANMVIALFSFGSYHVHFIFLNFLALIGIIGIYKSYQKALNKFNLWIRLTPFFVPSFLFWSSGLLKETLMIFSIGMVIHYLQLILHQFKPTRLILLLFFLFLLGISKSYLLIALAPGIIAHCIFKLSKSQKPIFIHSTVYLTTILLALSTSLIVPGNKVSHLLWMKQQAFIKLHSEQKPNSFIEIPHLEPNNTSMIKATPTAFFNAIFQPLLWEAKTTFMKFCSLENLFIVVFGISCFAFSVPKSRSLSSILILGISFAIAIYWLSAIVTPITGALVRYKIPAIPFIIIVFMSILDKDRLLNQFPKLSFLFHH